MQKELNTIMSCYVSYFSNPVARVAMLCAHAKRPWTRRRGVFTAALLFIGAWAFATIVRSDAFFGLFDPAGGVTEFRLPSDSTAVASPAKRQHEYLLINYANNCCRLSLRRNCLSGLSIGRFDRCLSFTAGVIEATFFRQHGSTFALPGGIGNWLWRSYVINHTLHTVPDGTIVIFSDAMVEFVKAAISAVDDLLEFCDVAVLASDLTHARGAPAEHARFVVLRNGSFARALAEQWVRICTDESLNKDITTSRSTDLSLFVDRLEQSIWSSVSSKCDLRNSWSTFKPLVKLHHLHSHD